MNLSPKTFSLSINPTQADFRNMMEKNPRAKKTNKGNYSIQTIVTARSSQSTFLVSKKTTGKPSITRKEYERIASLQDHYLNRQERVMIEGYIGADPHFRVGCCLVVESSHADIAAMQSQLYFPSDRQFTGKFTIIITPNLSAKGYPNQCLIAVDLEHWTTRILGSDYFGESKKGGLRMWNHWVYQQGGLALHAGCKVFQLGTRAEELALIIGLSGTGKTTTTFGQQMGSLPVQDDFCALFPNGRIYASENGCFAKTFRLNESDEPTIYAALTQPESWLENVTVLRDGTIDFFDGSYTTNGRGTFQLDMIPHRDPTALPPVKYIFLLNRNFDIIPAVARLNEKQAAQYFMLGETTGTSAGGESEAGRSLRVPGTNPFFTLNDALQGNRFWELIGTIPNLEIYLLNTGYVGGNMDNKGSKKVKIMHSANIIQAIVRHTIEWKEDLYFHYQIAANIPGFDDPDLLDPYQLYQKQGRQNEYEHIAARLKQEREAYLKEYPELNF